MVMFSACGLFAAETWWNETFEQRIAVTIEERTGVERQKTPVLIDGQAFLRATGATNVPVGSLRLIDAGGAELPLQVDERDPVGCCRNRAHRKLGPDDEIVFQVDMAANGKGSYWLYYSKTTMPEREPGDEVRCETVPVTAGHNYNAVLSNSCLLVGIRGGDGGTNLNVSEGCITRLSRDGRELVRPGPEGLLWGPVQSSVGWSRPELVAQGPVRATVAVQTDSEVDQEFERASGSWGVTAPTKGYLKGRIFRQFSLYGGLPYVECREVYRIEKGSPTFVAVFVFSFRTAPVSPLRRADILYGPWNGEIHEIGLAEKRFFDTPYPSDGWIAIHSAPSQNGLALFFDVATTVNVYANVIRGYLRDVSLGKPSDYGLTSDFVVCNKIEDFNRLRTAGTRYGLYVLEDATGEAIHEKYVTLWSSPLTVEWGKPENVAAPP